MVKCQCDPTALVSTQIPIPSSRRPFSGISERIGRTRTVYSEKNGCDPHPLNPCRGSDIQADIHTAGASLYSGCVATDPRNGWPGKQRQTLNPCVWFRVVVFCLFGIAHNASAGGGGFYLPNPEGACYERQDDTAHSEAAERDFGRNRDKYRVIVKHDQLRVFLQCNKGTAYCYRLPVVCGEDQQFYIWFWRLK